MIYALALTMGKLTVWSWKIAFMIDCQAPASKRIKQLGQCICFGALDRTQLWDAALI